MDMQFFADMAWKSALIAGTTLAVAATLRTRTAADRALVLRIGVVMLLALPVIALALPGLKVAVWSAPTPAPLPPLSDAELAMLMSLAPASAPEPSIWDDPTPLILLAWLGGVIMSGTRLLAGLATLARWTRRASEVVDPVWRDAFERVRWAAPRPESIRLLVADGPRSPLSWGWRRPVILIDADTLADPDEAEAILAHEIAHVARRDWPALMLARIAAALFWFNPLVWLLEREVVQQAEEAADLEAAAQIEPTRYAQTLLSLAQACRLVPANNMAPSARALSRRVKAVLNDANRPAGPLLSAFAVLACIGLAVPVAAMRLVAAEPAPVPQPPAAPIATAGLAPSAVAAPTPPAAPRAPGADAPEAPAAPAAPVAPAAPRVVVSGDIARAVNEAIATAMAAIPDVDAVVASAMASVDRDEIARAARSRSLTAAERARVRAALAQARATSRVEIDTAIGQARAQARNAVAIAFASSSVGLQRGADGMEQGARRMEQQAAQMRDQAWRARAIERARQRGETVTDEDLLETARGLEEGAREMREGARQMAEGRAD